MKNTAQLALAKKLVLLANDLLQPAPAKDAATGIIPRAPSGPRHNRRDLPGGGTPDLVQQLLDKAKVSPADKAGMENLMQTVDLTLLQQLLTHEGDDLHGLLTPDHFKRFLDSPLSKQDVSASTFKLQAYTTLMIAGWSRAKIHAALTTK